MAEIDERVVEMKFRRDDFLKGTEETLNALQRIDDTLAGAGGISSNLDKIGNSFSVLGTIGLGALMKVGNAAVDAGMKLVNNVMSPIFEGGKKRALNLEQANFQLMGILGNADDVAAIMDDVSYAVDGTAYGLDAAAVAASQFAASGMKAGDDMANALRGISGVAAMAGSSYEDVASVFTKVAGQGRLMGDDLNRLASRSINAASTMLDYYKQMGAGADMTEADIRDMVSKGQVSFEDFAEAMNLAFGEHATKANETYAGSLANIKSALGRIGAEYFIIEHEKMRKIFNALRPVINAFKKALDPVFEMYNRLYAIPMAKRFEAWGKSMEGVDFNRWTRPLEQFLVIGSTIRNVVSSWIKPIGDAFSAIFKPAPDGGWLRSVEVFLNGFNRGIGGLAASESQAAGVQNVFEGIFGAVQKFGGHVRSVFEAVGPVVTWLWDIFKVGIDYLIQGFEWLRPIIVDAFDALFGQEGKITTFWEKFQGKIEETGSVLETLGYYFQRLYDRYIAPVVQSFRDLRDALASVKTDGLGGLKGKLEQALEPLMPAWIWIKNLGVNIGDFFGLILNPLKWVRGQLPTVGDFIKNMFVGISDAIGNIAPALSGMFEGVGQILMDLGTGLVDMLKDVDIQQIAELGGAIAKLFSAIALFKALKSIKGVGDSITGFFGEAGAAMSRFGKETKTDQFLKIAISLGILAAALWVLSKIPGDKLLQGAATLTVLAGVMIGFVWSINKIDGGQLAKASFGLGLLAGALMGLTVVLGILALIPYETLVQGGVALALMLGAVTIAAVLIGTFGEHMMSGSFGLLLMAAALTLLIIPIQTLGSMDLATLEQGFFTLALALIALTVAAMLISASGESLLLGAIGLVLMAGALTLLIIPIQALGEMPYEQLIQGIGAIAITLLALAAAALMMQFLPMGAAGILAMSVAIVILAAGITILSNIPFGQGAAGLALLAGALLLLVVGAGAVMVVLPGVLGMAALMLAFGAAAILVGAASILFATGVLILSSALPSLTTNLAAFLALAPGFALATPALILLGAGLLVFGAAALVAGVGATLLGVGLTAMGLGLMMLAAFGESGTSALKALVKALTPLIKNVPAIAVMSATFTALGAALLVLGAGLLLAGAGGILFGVGATMAGIGIAVLVGMSALVAPLAERIAEGFGKLAGVVPGLTTFGVAVVTVSLGLSRFAAAGSALLDVLSRLLSAVMQVALGFIMIGSTALTASSMASSAMTTMARSMSVGAALIGAASSRIGMSFMQLAAAIMGSAPRAAAAATAVIRRIVAALTAGSVSIAAAILLITTAFQNLGKTIPVTGALAAISARLMMSMIVSELESGSRRVATAIATTLTTFGLLAVGIRQNGRVVSRAVGDVVTGVVTTLISSRTVVTTAAYSVGVAMGTGMSRGLSSQQARITNQARNMATSALNAAKSALEIRSPSGKFAEVGNFAVDGFLIPFSSRVSEAENASANMGNSMLDAMNSAIEEMESQFLDIDQWGMSPVITPVLDLDQAKRQMQGLGGTGSINSDLGRSQATSLALLDQALRQVSSSDDPKEGATVQFIQHNNSPKALSEAEIYRRTKNLISEIERKEL